MKNEGADALAHHIMHVAQLAGCGFRELLQSSLNSLLYRLVLSLGNPTTQVQVCTSVNTSFSLS